MMIDDMPKFRKKSLVIEAIQFNGMDSYLEIFDWMKSYGDTFALANEVRYYHPIMLIKTLEGTMVANPTDWIIKGVNNEFYPCNNEIFLKTYDEYN